MRSLTSQDLPRVLGPFSALCVVIGAIVGIGIFFTPTEVAAAAGGPAASLAAWVLGGVIAVLGALTFAELGSVYGRTGGQYEVLRDAYGPAVGFVYVFCNATAVQTGAIAIIAYLTALNLNIALLGSWLDERGMIGLGCGLIAAVTLANFVGVRWGAAVQNATVVAKLLALLAITALALFASAALPPADVATRAAASPTQVSFLAALVPVLFSYGGWQQALWVGGEIRRPERNVPLAMLGGVAVVIVVYLSVNWAYLQLLGYAGVVSSKALAADAVAAVWPQAGARVIAAAVAVSGLGVLNAQLLTGPRLICGMAEDGRFYRSLAHIHPRFRTPDAAIALLSLGGLALLVAVGPGNTLDLLLHGVVMVDSVLFLATGLALVVLRRRRPDLVWPFASPCFPLVPLGFALGELTVLIGAFSLAAYRNSAYVGVLWLAAGWLLYRVQFRHARPAKRGRSDPPPSAATD